MIKLDEQLITDLGLRELPTGHKNLVLQAIYSELETRVGTILAGQMSKQQRDEFDALIKADNDQEAFNWLQSIWPDYKSIVQGEFDKLCAELSDVRDVVTALSVLYAAKPDLVVG